MWFQAVGNDMNVVVAVFAATTAAAAAVSIFMLYSAVS